MSESLIISVGIVLVFTVLLLLPVAEALLSPVRRVKYACPWAGEEVLVKLVRRAAFGITQPPDVHSCSAFEQPNRPTCGKACLRVLA